MTSEQELQEKYLEFKFLSQQLEKVQQQILLLNQQTLELGEIEENLNNLSKIKKEGEGWAGIGGGIFIPVSTKKEYSELLVNVGADMYVKKSIEDSKKLVREQIENLQPILQSYEEAFNEIQNKLIELKNFFDEIQNAQK